MITNERESYGTVGDQTQRIHPQSRWPREFVVRGRLDRVTGRMSRTLNVYFVYFDLIAQLAGGQVSLGGCCRFSGGKPFTMQAWPIRIFIPAERGGLASSI